MGAELTRVVIKFDLSDLPSDVCILTATMNLYHMDTNGNFWKSLYSVKSPWTPQGIRFLDLGKNPGKSSTPDKFTSSNNAYIERWEPFDLTEQVHKWGIGTELNNGLHIEMPWGVGTVNLYYASASYNDPKLRPNLNIIYTNTPHLTILTPKNNDILKIVSNFSYSIEWKSFNTDSVKIELLKGNSIVQVITSSVAVENNQYQKNNIYGWSIPNGLSAGSDYKIKITNLKDSSVFDISELFTIKTPHIISTFPYNQNFDSFSKGSELGDNWGQSVEDGFDWQVLSGPTPTHIDGGETWWPNSGPNAGHNGTGTYLYAEANGHHGRSAVVSPPLFDTKNSDKLSLSFWYNMWSEDGNNMGTLKLDMRVEQGAWVNIMKKSGCQGIPWHKAEVDLSAIDDYKKGFVEFRFVGTIKGTNTSDIAIDDFKIIETGIVSTNKILLTPPNSSFFALSNGYLNLNLANSINKNVRVSLFDLRGREVAVLVDDLFGTGEFKINISTVINSLSSGAYVCKMKIDGFNITKSTIIK